MPTRCFLTSTDDPRTSSIPIPANHARWPLLVPSMGEEEVKSVQIWIVHGSTGEYSDRQEWVVEAHSTEAAAQARIERLDQLMLETGVNTPPSRYSDRSSMIKVMRDHAEGDPFFNCDYTGTSYYMSQCILVRS
jgi:hypothetical protein